MRGDKKKWLNDKIAKGEIYYTPGQQVVLFRRNADGYPKTIKDSEWLTIWSISDEHLMLKIDGSNRTINVHRSFFIPVFYLRKEKIKKILQHK